jgi:hypothetical protein
MTGLAKKKSAFCHSQKLDGAAHDFNNLLVGVSGNARLARRCFRPSRCRETDGDGHQDRRTERSPYQAKTGHSGKGKFLLKGLDMPALVRDIIEPGSSLHPEEGGAAAGVDEDFHS